MDLHFKTMPGTFNVDEAQGIVECFVAAVGNKDSVGDIVMPGAFNGSLRRRKPRVVWGHDWNQPIGKVLDIYEVPPNDPRLPDKMKAAGVGGLYARVQFNLKSERGREAFHSIAFFGEDQEWSIGYKTLDSIYSQERSANLLKEVELYEVSPVLHGANQLTATISIKSEKQDKEQIDSFRKSKWKVFDPDFAEMVRSKHPDIWGKGGNIKGNDQYRALLPIWRKGKASSEAEINAMELREAWVARHAQDFQLPGVVAQMKWLAVGSRGEAYMKDVIREAIDKKEQKAAGSAKEKAANPKAMELLDQLKGILSQDDDDDFTTMLADLKAQFGPVDPDDPEEMDDDDDEKVGMAGADEPKLTRRILNFPKGDCGCGCGGSCATGKKDLLGNESPLAQQLSSMLGRVVAFYFKSHAAHWNVEGVDFAQYHDLFGQIYTDVHTSVDGWAENIRKLGAAAPGSLFEFGMNQTPETRSETASAGSLARELIADNAALIAEMKRVFKTADEADEQGVADFIAARIDIHQKWQWFLSASVKNAEIKSIIDEIESKAGRVIANRNMSRLRQALDLLRQVVEEGDPQGGLQMKSTEAAPQYLVMDVTPETMFEVKSYLDDFADFHGADVILDEDEGEWIAIEAKGDEMMNVVLDFFQGRQDELQIKGFFYGEQDVDHDVEVKRLPFDYQVKARRKIGGWQYAQAYDPNAVDGDEDGDVQDNTPWERPAPPKKPRQTSAAGRQPAAAQPTGKPTPKQPKQQAAKPQPQPKPERQAAKPKQRAAAPKQPEGPTPGIENLARDLERQKERAPRKRASRAAREEMGGLPTDPVQLYMEEHNRNLGYGTGRKPISYEQAEAIVKARDFWKNWPPDTSGTPATELLGERVFYRESSPATRYDPAEYGEISTDRTFFGEDPKDAENFVGRIIADKKGNVGIVDEVDEPDDDLTPYPDDEYVPEENVLQVRWAIREGKLVDNRGETEKVSSRDAKKYTIYDRPDNWEQLLDDVFLADTEDAESAPDSQQSNGGDGDDRTEMERAFDEEHNPRNAKSGTSARADAVIEHMSQMTMGGGSDYNRIGDIRLGEEIEYVDGSGQKRKGTLEAALWHYTESPFSLSGKQKEIDYFYAKIKDAETGRYVVADVEATMEKSNDWRRPGKMLKLKVEANEYSSSGAGDSSAVVAESRLNGLPTPEEFDAMKAVGGPLGSQGGGWFEDKKGQKYLVKPAKSEDHAQNELSAHLFYKHMGIATDDTGIFERDGKFYIAKRAVQDKKGNLGKTVGRNVTPEVSKQAQKGFAADALASSWDVFGLTGDNVITDAKGNLHRIDVGGSFRFRAQGGDKTSFAPGQPWVEPFSMRESEQGKKLYGDMTDARAASLLEKSAKDFDGSKLYKELRDAGVDEGSARHVVDTLNDRINNQLPDILDQLRNSAVASSDTPILRGVVEGKPDGSSKYEVQKTQRENEELNKTKERINSSVAQAWNDIQNGVLESRPTQELFPEGKPPKSGIYVSADGRQVAVIANEFAIMGVHVIRQDGKNLDKASTFSILKPEYDSPNDDTGRQALAELLGDEAFLVPLDPLYQFDSSVGKLSWNLMRADNVDPINGDFYLRRAQSSLERSARSDKENGKIFANMSKAERELRKLFTANMKKGGRSKETVNPFDVTASPNARDPEKGMDRLELINRMEAIEEFAERMDLDVQQEAIYQTQNDAGHLLAFYNHYAGKDNIALTEAASALLAYYYWKLAVLDNRKRRR